MTAHCSSTAQRKNVNGFSSCSDFRFWDKISLKLLLCRSFSFGLRLMGQ
jgi:hypothetical protein